ncbi:MAG: precorrin-6y C5,15-methyltransferase (decarboxylating) subunit CbiE [Actinomycetota bacterium]|nr:precorrin-6y C5,15-methyltransferase (decarboxylating) subunit CbiE [Actinomycetota bacterium]
MGGSGVITVIGLDGSRLTDEAADAVATAGLVVGGRRQLAAISLAAGARAMTLGPLAPALDALAAHRAGDAVVLASGDPGFFGILRCLRERGLACTVLPAVSSVSLAFARAMIPWDDAQVVSAHGRDPRHAVNVCRAHPKVAVLTGPGCGPAELGCALDGWQRRFIVAEHLGTPDERITECPAADAVTREWEDPNVVLVLADMPAGGPRLSWPPACAPDGWALAEDSFDQRDAVITKAEVRAIALARLAPGPGRLIWDVGAGTGSVGIECARFGAAVIAVERDPRRAERVRANAARHAAGLRLVTGEAPAALAGLPQPDAVFVGGGGAAVAEAVAARHPGRIVVTLAAVERAGPVTASLTAAGYLVDGALVSSARLVPLPGGVHRLGPINPVFVLWGSRDTLPRMTAGKGGPR